MLPCPLAWFQVRVFQVSYLDGDLDRLFKLIEVTIKTPCQQVVKLEVDPNDTTFAELKVLIESATGLPADEQRLCTPTGAPMSDYVDEYLADELLSAAGVKHGASLKLGLPVRPPPAGLKLNIKTLTGASVVIQGAQPDWTVSQVKQVLESRNGMPADDQSLIYKGKQLENSYTLSAYDIANDDVLHVKLRMGGPKRSRVFSELLQAPPLPPLTATATATLPVLTCKPAPFIMDFKRDVDVMDVVEPEKDTFDNQWPRYQSFKDFFTEKFYPSRVMLIELSPEYTRLPPLVLALRIEQERYNTFTSTGGYYGGDHRSWQRFTRKEPVPLIVEHKGQLYQRITARLPPGAPPLKPGTRYALALLHTGFRRSGVLPPIYDDQLYPFVTEGEAPRVAAATDGAAAAAAAAAAPARAPASGGAGGGSDGASGADMGSC